MNSNEPAQIVPAVPETEEQRLARLQREAEINKVAPTPQTNTGPDTTGVGQPTAQAVQQGQSLPATAMPVTKGFENTQNYNPLEDERLIAEKAKADSGGQKTDI